MDKLSGVAHRISPHIAPVVHGAIICALGGPAIEYIARPRQCGVDFDPVGFSAFCALPVYFGWFVGRVIAPKSKGVSRFPIAWMVLGFAFFCAHLQYQRLEHRPLEIALSALSSVVIAMLPAAVVGVLPFDAQAHQDLNAVPDTQK